MYHFVLMHIPERFQHILHDAHCRLLLVDMPRFDSFEQLSTIEIRQHQMNVFVAFVNFVQFNHVGVLQLPQDIDLLQDALNVPLALFDVGFFHCFESVFCFVWITFTGAAVDFGEVASAKELTHLEFILEV